MAHDFLHGMPCARIKVFGIGGGGTNAVSTMIRSNIEGVEFIAANSDVQSLRFSLAPKKIQIGKELTKGLGAGADPDVGRDAALEDRHEIQEALAGADMVFITAGMGGGTGTGGASVVAQIAKEMGALTVGVVTKPFFFEGNRRKKHAQIGIDRLREYVDTLIVIPNQQLLKIATPDLSMIDAFNLADNVLVNAVRGISDIINIPGTVNVDFADVKAIMSATGRALMGVGRGRGSNRAIEAATSAVSSPLLEDVDIEGATGILINITAGSNVSLFEVNEACSIIQEAAHEDANIIFGAVIDESLDDEMRVTVIATGFPCDDRPIFEERPKASSTLRSYKQALEDKRKTPETKAVETRPIEPKFQSSYFKDAASFRKESTKVSPVQTATLQQQVKDEAQDLAFLTLRHAGSSMQEKKEMESFSFDEKDSCDKQPEISPNYEAEHLIDIKQGIFEKPSSLDLEVSSHQEEFFASKERAQVFQQNKEEELKKDIYFEKTEDILAQKIDRKIDEALSLADKLMFKHDEKQDVSSSKEETEEDLDIPTFLRQQNSSKSFSFFENQKF